MRKNRIITSLIILCAAVIMAGHFGVQDTYATTRSMNVNEWLQQCRSICVKITKEKAVYSSKGCPTSYFDKKFKRSRYGKKTRLHCADYVSWCLQRYKVIPAGQRFWVKGQQIKGQNAKQIKKSKKIQRIMIAKKGIPASQLVQRTGTKSLKKGDLVSVVRKTGSGHHIQIYAGTDDNGKMIFYMVSHIATVGGKSTRLDLTKMTTQSRDPYNKDPRIAMIIRVKGLKYIDAFKVTTTAGDHGTIDETRNVKWGGTGTFHITPDDGYRISTFKVDGKIVKISKTAKSYTIRNVKATHRIDVTFEKDPNAPEKPDTPDTPEQPTTPEQPSQPSQPGESGQSSGSDAQNPGSGQTDNGTADNGKSANMSDSKSAGADGAAGNESGALKEDGE